MNPFGTRTLFRISMSLALGAILLLGLATYGYGSGWQGQARPLPDSEIASLVGGWNVGACGILVGLVVGVVAAGSGTLTVGLGAAFAISVGMHISAALCVS